MVTDQCLAWCPDCMAWRHLKDFYTVREERYDEVAPDGTRTWYGRPSTYCSEHRKARGKESRLRNSRSYQRSGDSLLAPTRLSENYPPLSHIRKVLVDDYGVTNDQAKALLADQLFDLWDRVQADKANDH